MIDIIAIGIASLGVSGFGIILYHGRKKTPQMRRLKKAAKRAHIKSGINSN